MLYKFKSNATGDVVMNAPLGDEVLRLIGRQPAPQGIIEVDAMPAAIAALERAATASTQSEREPGAAEAAEAQEARTGEAAVALHARIWPMVEMLKRSHEAGEPVVWGV